MYESGGVREGNGEAVKAGKGVEGKERATESIVPMSSNTKTSIKSYMLSSPSKSVALGSVILY